jgi:hypothetical protein
LIQKGINQPIFGLFLIAAKLLKSTSCADSSEAVRTARDQEVRDGARSGESATTKEQQQMPDDTKDAAEFSNGQPYTAIAGELVADALALFELVRARRPETHQIPGVLHLTVDSQAGTIIVGLRQESGDVVLIERVAADPRDAATFGSSVLPVVIDPGGQTH